MSCPSGWDATDSHCMRTRPVCCRVGDRLDGNGWAKVSFDFLGFTLHWRRARSGRWGMWCKTRSSRVQRAMTVAAAWCRRHRHLTVAVQHAALTRRIQGHFNYFGVSGNARSVGLLVDATERHWYTWLRRRSNRTRLTWPRFVALLERYPLPVPRIRVRIWGASAPAAPPGHLHECARARTSDPRLLDSLQSAREAVHLDQGGRHHPREG